MKFTPKSESELQSQDLLPAGIYDVEVFRAEDKQSKAGNDMIELGLKVYGDRTVLINDYLMEKMMFKLKHACDTFGLSAEYENGTLQADYFEGKSGKAKITIQKGKDKGDGTMYPDRNSVADYIRKSGAEAKEVVIDDSVPF